MKHIFSALILLFTLNNAAQITLEHTYQGEVKRGKLEKSGEKYYKLDGVNQRVTLYNKDHSLWQEIAFPVDTNGTVIRIFEISETKIIPDNLIEVIYLFDGGVDGLFLRIMNETGTILLDKAFVSTFELSAIPGHPTKLITTNGLASTEIIGVPNLLSEHVFTGYNARRMLLDNGDVKYFYTDGQQLHIYNEDYSVYKDVNLPNWLQGGSAEVVYASQNRVNPDLPLEILIRKFNGQSTLINENGVEMKRSTTGFLSISDYLGHPAKLLFNDTVFSLPSLTVDHIYKNFYPFSVLTESGPKYLMGWNDSLRAYDTSHKLLFNVKVPHSYNYFLSNLYNYSENIFNTDNKFELLYRCINMSSDSAGAEGKICNQDGTTLFHEDDLNYFTLSQIGGGSPNKLMAYISNWEEPVYQTKVYSLPSVDLTNVDVIDNEWPLIDICPNPASARFTLCGAKDKTYLVTLFNINGAELSREELTSDQEFNLQGFPKGIYVVTIDDETGHRTTRKLVVN